MSGPCLCSHWRWKCLESDYLIDKILPRNRIHLLEAGISSAGKSRFMLPALVLWNAGIPVIGLESDPVPWCMVCRDRPLQDSIDTIEKIGFNPSIFTRLLLSVD